MRFADKNKNVEYLQTYPKHVVLFAEFGLVKINHCAFLFIFGQNI